MNSFDLSGKINAIIVFRSSPISPTFYKQLLRTLIPKAQKDSQIKQLFVLLGPACVKADRKHVDEINHRSSMRWCYAAFAYPWRLRRKWSNRKSRLNQERLPVAAFLYEKKVSSRLSLIDGNLKLYQSLCLFYSFIAFLFNKDNNISTAIGENLRVFSASFRIQAFSLGKNDVHSANLLMVKSYQCLP